MSNTVLQVKMKTPFMILTGEPSYHIGSLLVALSFIILFLPVTTIASDDNSQDCTTMNSKKVDKSLFITAETLTRQMNQGKDITLVDIRPADDFNRARIPGSLNIPLHFIRTKMFLKQTPVVLVTAGYQYNLLESECRKLRQQGFAVSLLWGGLNYWKQIKGPLEGDMWAHERFNQVAPRCFYPERDYEHWVVLDVTIGSTVKNVIPGAVKLPVTEDRPLTPERIRQSIKKQGKPCYVLFVNEKGVDYQHIESAVRQTKLKNVFYLEGGAAAYREFIQGVSLSHKPKDQRMQEIKKCPTCG